MSVLAPHDAVPIRSELLARAGFAHAFFTRQGGASPAPFHSLNFGTAAGSGDDVRENLCRAARALGVPPSRLYLASQVHGRTALVLSGTEEREAVAVECADALVTSAAGVACCLRVADCVPVLIGDRRSGAVAAVHSGWRGTVANVVGAAILALRKSVDAGERDLVAAIGPHIGPCCFEVDQDVAEKLAACPAGPKAVLAVQDRRARVDLRMIVRAELEDSGISASDIDDIRGCTACDAERFFSYRRDREKSGRMLAAIVGRNTRV